MADPNIIGPDDVTDGESTSEHALVYGMQNGAKWLMGGGAVSILAALQAPGLEPRERLVIIVFLGVFILVSMITAAWLVRGYSKDRAAVKVAIGIRKTGAMILCAGLLLGSMSGCYENHAQGVNELTKQKAEILQRDADADLSNAAWIAFYRQIMQKIVDNEFNQAMKENTDATGKVSTQIATIAYDLKNKKYAAIETQIGIIQQKLASQKLNTINAAQRCDDLIQYLNTGSNASNVLNSTANLQAVLTKLFPSTPPAAAPIAPTTISVQPPAAQ